MTYLPGSAFTWNSGFGMRRLPERGNIEQLHSGIDWAAPLGTPVRAAYDGRVIYFGNSTGFGHTVVIQHYDDAGRPTYRTGYAHLQDPTDVIPIGQFVSRGEIIGGVGRGGNVVGVQAGRGVLHYMVFNETAPQPTSTSLNMWLSRGESLPFLENPATFNNYGEHGAYHDTGVGNFDILYRTDRFYRDGAAGMWSPLAESNRFIRPSENSSVLVSVTPEYNNQSVQIGERATYADGSFDRTLFNPAPGILSTTDYFNSGGQPTGRSTEFPDQGERIEFFNQSLGGRTGT